MAGGERGQRAFNLAHPCKRRALPLGPFLPGVVHHIVQLRDLRAETADGGFSLGRRAARTNPMVVSIDEKKGGGDHAAAQQRT